MNERQRIAYASPCFEAEECTASEFRRFRRISEYLAISTILTANIGLE